MSEFHRGKANIIKVTDEASLDRLEEFHRPVLSEFNPIAVNTSWKELCRIVPDRFGGSLSDHAAYLVETNHRPEIGAMMLGRFVFSWLQKKNTWDILSVSSQFSDDRLSAVVLIRVYDAFDISSIRDLYQYVDERYVLDQKAEDPGRIYINKKKDEEKPVDLDAVNRQKELYQTTDPSVPYLNLMDSYEEEFSRDTIEELPITASVYSVKTISSNESFVEMFCQAVSYLTTVEYNNYKEVLISGAADDVRKRNFDIIIDQYLYKTFVTKKRLPEEDTVVMKQKLYEALFGYYVIEELLSIDEVTDVKITGPNEIIARKFGKACETNLSFIDLNDYLRFVEGLALKNGIDLSLPTQTFTDSRNPDYVLRFTITAAYVSSSGIPILHIRKVSRKKLLGKDLIDRGMFDERVMRYLKDCGKNSRGVVFAGPPGSGKTVLLNWFLEEAYEKTAEILVIQENDELFTYRKGVMIEHVVLNPREDEKACDLEELGRMALVSGANVFIIGETKGAEICSAITLSNSGCRTAMTIHSPSAEETIDKMADLALRGYAKSFEIAKRMMKSFQTIVYLQDFKVQEIKEIVGYDEEKKDMIYKAVFSREN